MMKRLIRMSLGFMSMALLPLAYGQQQPRIGVVLPLSGHSASAGIEAREVLMRKLGNAHLIVMDTTTSPEVAVSQVRRLQVEEKVDLIIGPTLVSETLAVASSKPSVPVFSLAAAPTKEVAAKFGEARILAFVQPERQLADIVAALPRGMNFKIGSPPFFAAKAEEVKNALGSRAVETDLALGVTTLQPFTATAIQRKLPILVIVAPNQAEVLLAALRTEQGGGVIISPPTSGQFAAIAAELVNEWRKGKSPSPSTWRDINARSPLFDKSTNSLALGWNVSTRAIQYAVASSSGKTTTCTCKSHDGNITHSKECKDPPEKCEKKEEKTDCSCSCSSG